MRLQNGGPQCLLQKLVLVSHFSDADFCKWTFPVLASDRAMLEGRGQAAPCRKGGTGHTMLEGWGWAAVSEAGDRPRCGRVLVLAEVHPQGPRRPYTSLGPSRASFTPAQCPGCPQAVTHPPWTHSPHSAVPPLPGTGGGQAVSRRGPSQGVDALGIPSVGADSDAVGEAAGERVGDGSATHVALLALAPLHPALAPRVVESTEAKTAASAMLQLRFPVVVIFA